MLSYIKLKNKLNKFPKMNCNGNMNSTTNSLVYQLFFEQHFCASVLWEPKFAQLRFFFFQSLFLSYFCFSFLGFFYFAAGINFASQQFVGSFNKSFVGCSFRGNGKTWCPENKAITCHVSRTNPFDYGLKSIAIYQYKTGKLAN